MESLMQELIQDGETLVGASHTGSGTPISVYDDGFGPLWLMRDSMSIMGIVRAQTWEDAYSIAEDEFFPEAEETVADLEREYGADWSENDLFNEAYGFRPNGPNAHDKRGHGIYQKDLNGEALDRLTIRLLDDIGISLEIEQE